MRGHLHVVKWFVEQYEWLQAVLKYLWINEAMNLAAAHGNMETLQYLSTHQADLPANTQVLECGIASRNLDIVIFLHDHNCTSEKDLLVLAVATGDFAMVEWVHNNCDIKSVSTSAMDISAEFNLEIVKFLHEYRAEGCTVRAINDAAAAGNVYLLLHQYRLEREASQALRSAATNGRINVVRWLHENAAIPGDKLDLAYVEAVERGQTEVPVYLATHCGARCSICIF